MNDSIPLSLLLFKGTLSLTLQSDIFFFTVILERTLVSDAIPLGFTIIQGDCIANAPEWHGKNGDLISYALEWQGLKY